MKPRIKPYERDDGILSDDPVSTRNSKRPKGIGAINQSMNAHQQVLGVDAIA